MDFKDKIQVVIMRYNSPACEELQEWLGFMGLDWRNGVGSYEIDVARNMNVRRFLQEDTAKGKEYLLMMDEDMVPIPESIGILQAPGDLVYCSYPDKRGRINHYGNNTMASGCVRMSAGLLRSIPAPWFRTGHTGNMLDHTNCDCNFFRDRAREVGVDAQMVGLIGHLQKTILMAVPDSGGKRWRMVFRGEVAYRKGEAYWTNVPGPDGAHTAARNPPPKQVVPVPAPAAPETPQAAIAQAVESAAAVGGDKPEKTEA